MKKVAIIVTLILAMGVAAGSCITINPPAKTPTTEEPASASALETGSAVTITPIPAPPPPSDIPQELLATWKSKAVASAETAPEVAPVVTSITTALPAGPKVPQEVLAIWKSEPASVASPPDVKDRITLQPNTAIDSTLELGGISLSVIPAGTFQDSTSFHLEEGQWADVIVFSLDIPVYFNWEESGAISLTAECWGDYEGKKTRTSYPQMAQVVGEPPSRDVGVSGPTSGKPLYENLATSTEEGTIFITAARIFAWEGATDYWFVSYNWNRQKVADLTCCVYKLGVTPGWGKEYTDTKILPWLNELYYMLVSGEISQEEYDLAESKWLEQFQ